MMARDDTLLFHRILSKVMGTPAHLVTALKDSCEFTYSPETWISARRALDDLQACGVVLPGMVVVPGGWTYLLTVDIPVPDDKPVKCTVSFILDNNLTLTVTTVMLGISGDAAHQRLASVYTGETTACDDMKIVVLGGIQWGVFGGHDLLLNILTQNTLKCVFNTADMDVLTMLYATTDNRMHSLQVTINGQPYKTLSPGQTIVHQQHPSLVMDLLLMVAELLAAQVPEARQVNIEYDETNKTLSLDTDSMRGQ